MLWNGRPFHKSGFTSYVSFVGSVCIDPSPPSIGPPRGRAKVRRFPPIPEDVPLTTQTDFIDHPRPSNSDMSSIAPNQANKSIQCCNCGEKEEPPLVVRTPTKRPLCGDCADLTECDRCCAMFNEREHSGAFCISCRSLPDVAMKLAEAEEQDGDDICFDCSSVLTQDECTMYCTGPSSGGWAHEQNTIIRCTHCRRVAGANRRKCSKKRTGALASGKPTDEPHTKKQKVSE